MRTQQAQKAAASPDDVEAPESSRPPGNDRIDGDGPRHARRSRAVKSASPLGTPLRLVASLTALVVAGGLVSLVFWPGFMDEDTVGEIYNTSSGHLTNWHTPLLSSLWRAGYLVGLRSPGWVLMWSVVTLLIGFYLILRVRFSQPLSALGAILCLLFPPVLTWAVHVGVDQWFGAFILCAFGLVARTMRSLGRARLVTVVAAVTSACLAAAARNNAAPAILVCLLVLAWLLLPPLSHRFAIAAAIGILATVGVFVLETGIAWALGTQSVHPEQNTFIYDLAQLSKKEHRDLFPRTIERFDHHEDLARIEANISPQSADAILYGSPTTTIFTPIPLEGAQYNALRHAWESAVLSHPAAYLSERLEAGIWLLSIGHPSYWLYDPPNAVAQYLPKFPSLDRVGVRYLSLFTTGGNLYGDFIYDVWIYTLILCMASVVLMRRTLADRALAGLSLAMLFYLVVFVFVSTDILYRYMFPLVASATVLAPVLLPRKVLATAPLDEVDASSSHSDSVSSLDGEKRRP